MNDLKQFWVSRLISVEGGKERESEKFLNRNFIEALKRFWSETVVAIEISSDSYAINHLFSHPLLLMSRYFRIY